MSVAPLLYPKFKACVPGSSTPAVGYKLYTCVAGSTGVASLTPSYTDSTGATPNSNPVILNSSGEAAVWMPITSRLVLKDASDVQIWDIDNVPGGLIADALSSTSTTSLTIPVAFPSTQTLTVDTGKGYLPGMGVRIAYTTDTTNWMFGEVTSYNSGTGVLVVSVSSVQGSGTYTAWTIALSGVSGADGAAAWKTLTAGTDFTAIPATTATLTMLVDHTASILVNMPLKYKIASTWYYGKVNAITAGLLTVDGAALSGTIQELQYGGGIIRQIVIIIPGNYEDASNTALIVSDLHSSFIWTLPKSYCVQYRKYSNTHDSHATHGQASVRINNVEVNTTTGGLTIAADATWYATAVDISTAAYDINPGEALEITAVKGGNGDAADLTTEIYMLTP